MHKNFKKQILSSFLNASAVVVFCRTRTRSVLVSDLLKYIFFIISILERGRAWLIIELPWGGNNNKNYTIEVGALPSQSVKELHTQVICGCIIVGLVVGWYRFCFFFVFASCLFYYRPYFVIRSMVQKNSLLFACICFTMEVSTYSL